MSVFSINAVKTDKDKAVNGVDFKVGETTFTVAKWGNKKFNERMLELVGDTEPDPFNINVGSAITDEVAATLFAELILLNWSKLKIDPDDKDYTPYSKDIVKQLYLDEENEDFINMIMDWSKNSANFRAVKVEKAKKKSAS